MGTCMFRYIFDIKLGLPEAQRFNVNYSGINCVVIVRRVSGANITSYSQNDYSWITKNRDEDKRIEDVEIKGQYGQNLELIRHIKYYKNKGVFSGGVIEPSSFVILELMYSVPDKKYLEKKININSLKEKSQGILTYFIEMYRFISQENDIYIPSIEHAKVFELLYSNSHISASKAMFTLMSQSHNWMGISSPTKEILSSDKIDTFSELLKIGFRFPVHQQLLMDAKEQGAINKNYEVSILKINTAFEVFMQSILIQACDKLNIQELPVGKGKLETLSKKNSREAIMEGGLVKDLLKNYLYIITGKSDILSVKEYNKWNEHSYKIRNQIIHTGYSNVTESEAKLAFEATISLIDKISSEVKEVADTRIRSEISLLLGL